MSAWYWVGKKADRLPHRLSLFPSPRHPPSRRLLTSRREADHRSRRCQCAPDKRGGKLYYTMRDLRNGNIVKNVTRSSARRLWHYAIRQHMEMSENNAQPEIQWQGDYGLIRKYTQGNTTRYDLIQRTPAGNRYFFGVTEDGIHGPWRRLVGLE